MDNNFHKGQIKRWDEGKGFGFIESKNGKKDIFIHISALKRRMSRRPIVGDILIYQIHTDKDGKKRAVNAKIQGVAEIKPSVRKKHVKHEGSYKGLINIVAIVMFMLLAFIIYNRPAKISTGSKAAVVPTSYVPLKQKRTVNYNCNGKVYCSEMTSCEEASYYQNNCPDTKMDGDGDGVPCEGQWCRW